mmetsp:Transcript_44307/g.117612  ORF Transcript_44307/g.117612 Transcript_44307/m.117612 type:complete len:319 (+) Transcript_44307:2-958(+)
MAPADMAGTSSRVTSSWPPCPGRPPGPSCRPAKGPAAMPPLPRPAWGACGATGTCLTSSKISVSACRTASREPEMLQDLWPMASSRASWILAPDFSRISVRLAPCLPITTPAASLRTMNTTWTSPNSVPAAVAASASCWERSSWAVTTWLNFPITTARRSDPMSLDETTTLHPAEAAVCFTWAPAFPRIAPARRSGTCTCTWISSGSALGGCTWLIPCAAAKGAPATPPKPGTGMPKGVPPSPSTYRMAYLMFSTSPLMTTLLSSTPFSAFTTGSRSSETRTRHSSRTLFRLSPPLPTTPPALSCGMQIVWFTSCIPV